LPQNFSQWSKTWKSSHPKWEYRLWDDKENRDLLETHFPWFMDTYNGFSREIYRADAARAAYLYLFGGLYVDLDFVCLKNHEDLFSSEADVYLGEMEPGHPHGILNAWMASKKGCDFWIHFLHQIDDEAKKGKASKMIVENLTGSVALFRAIKTYNGKAKIKLIEGSKVYPINHICGDPRELMDKGVEEMRKRWPDAFAVTFWTGS